MSEYRTDHGTSLSAPAIAGITALMMDALDGSGSLRYYAEEFGKSGFDSVYGNGEILAYDSIKATGGYSNGSFDDYRDHLIDSRTIQQGLWVLYNMEVYDVDPSLYWATTLIMTDEDNDNFDLYIWNPVPNKKRINTISKHNKYLDAIIISLLVALLSVKLVYCI